MSRPLAPLTAAGETKAPADAGAVTVQESGDGRMELHWPCLVIEGMETGDGRFIPYGSLGHRALPLSVMGQIKTDDGHKGASVFGKITRLERHEGPTVISKETGKPFPEGTAVWEAWGEGDATSEPGRLAAQGYLTGNSADLAEATVEESLAEDGQRPIVKLVGGKIAGTTLVPIPAFADGYVEIDGVKRDPAAGVAVEPLSASAWTILDEGLAVTASGESPRPPAALFADQRLRERTPITLRRVGAFTHVYGHLAPWDVPHIGFGGKPVHPPRGTDYRMFNTGAVRALDEAGQERHVAVGRLTIGGGHAGPELSAREAIAHYDDAGTAWAWVQAYDDDHGVAVSGIVIPDVDDATVTRALAHPPSGDWRPLGGRLELVAALGVNTAGFPVYRSRVASGVPVSLVAGGGLAAVADNVHALADQVTGQVLDGLREMLERAGVAVVTSDEADAGPALADRHAALARELAVADLLDELEADPAELAELPVLDLAALALDPLEHLDDDDRQALARGKNWVDQTGGLPPYIKRIKKHLEDKGMDESRAIATAVNVVKKMCATGDVNFPGSQQVNAGSRAEACAAVARWNAQRAKAKAS